MRKREETEREKGEGFGRCLGALITHSLAAPPWLINKQRHMSKHWASLQRTQAQTRTIPPPNKHVIAVINHLRTLYTLTPTHSISFESRYLPWYSLLTDWCHSFYPNKGMDCSLMGVECSWVHESACTIAHMGYCLCQGQGGRAGDGFPELDQQHHFITKNRVQKDFILHLLTYTSYTKHP